MPTKICTKCQERLPLEGFHKDPKNLDKLKGACKKCISKYHKERQAIHISKGLCKDGCGNSPVPGKTLCQKCSDKKYAFARSYRQRVLDYYGQFCVCCASVGILMTEYEFLSLDHVNNDGAEHRRQIGPNITLWIIRNIINNDGQGKERFQILCHNCNMAKEKFQGGCPHQSHPERFQGANAHVKRQIQFHNATTRNNTVLNL